MEEEMHVMPPEDDEYDDDDYVTADDNDNDDGDHGPVGFPVVPVFQIVIPCALLYNDGGFDVSPVVPLFQIVIPVTVPSVASPRNPVPVSQ